MERAAEVLLRGLRQGRLSAQWRLRFDLASVDPLEYEAFEPFLEEREAEERRLREKY
jgi:hypothetical protein